MNEINDLKKNQRMEKDKNERKQKRFYEKEMKEKEEENKEKVIQDWKKKRRLEATSTAVITTKLREVWK